MNKKLELMAKKEAKSKTLGAKLFTKAGVLSTNAKNAIQMAPKRGNRIYPFSWGGSARHIRAIDNTDYIKRFLKLAGMKFKTGNDAPKGGKEGNYLQVSATAMRLLKSV